MEEQLNKLGMAGYPVQLETCRSGWACNVWEGEDAKSQAVRAFGLDKPSRAVRVAFEIVTLGKWEEGEDWDTECPAPIVYGKVLKAGKVVKAPLLLDGWDRRGAAASLKARDGGG